ncbi:MAG: DNA polymerase IV [Liquorilactobacillus hordei]|uniref:DNA polymerase IV n=1 Tax=Liquorilactobacillus hordei DSM 19519 TaxID=1423759 RepID=A0A0R1MRR5_9LACO|nr:DNA polymerase IV [Liquorilactobacillus hordei]KRL07845.1 DNA polymerase IV [Liquorilactobacillus hordei DSM 19519]QYH52096.1 DNA polymerase IV [Liquorilactobacillus hordei DSM 19519]
MVEQRKIIHVDMDAFYASIEMRDNPKIREKAVVIAKNPRHTGGKGVVATANYIARSKGIHSAMSAQQAMELCPEAIFVKPDFKKYRAVSAQIHEIFHEYTDIIEPIAFDEAYLDVTQNKKEIHNPLIIARMLQQEIFSKTHLTSSTGISYNKFLAKMASDYHKPVGTTLIREEDVLSFLAPLPIEKFRGVGVKTAKKMHELAINTGLDLLKKSELELIANFGKMGEAFFQHVRGIDERPVEWKRERKSMGNERTFAQALKSTTEVEEMFKYLTNLLIDQLSRRQLHGKTIVIKVRNSNFETVTKRRTLDNFYQNNQETLVFHALQLFDEVQSEVDVRLLGLTMTNLAPLQFENIELPLWQM